MTIPTPVAVGLRWLLLTFLFILSAAQSLPAQQFWKQDTALPANWDNVTPDWYGNALFTGATQAWMGGVANFSGSGTPTNPVNVAANVSATQLNFSLSGYTLSGVNTITMAGANPSINLGGGTTGTAFNTAIAANISAAGSVGITDSFNPGVSASYNLLSLTGSTQNFGGSTGSLTLTSGSNAKEQFLVGHTAAWNLQTLNLVGAVNGKNLTFVGGAFDTSKASTFTGAFPAATAGVMNFSGAAPTITWGGSSTNDLQGSPAWTLFDAIANSSSAPLHLIANSSVFSSNGTQTPAQPVLNFGVPNTSSLTTLSPPHTGSTTGTVLGSSFASGIILDNSLPVSGGGAWDSTQGYTWTARYNFNQAGATGTGAGAGTISVAANGLCMTDVGGANSVYLTRPNPIVLNSNNIDPVNSAAGGLFLTAIGATKAGNINTDALTTSITYSGVISGNGAIVIGNDLSRPSGGAGLTILGNNNMYAGKTIFNGTYNTSTNSISVLRLATTNALPTNNILQFGYSDNLAQGTLTTKPLGTVDLFGFNQTIASLVSSVDPGTPVNGITNTDTLQALPGQLATPTLTINGATNDWFTGGLGTVQASGPQYPNLKSSTANIGLTRTGLGSTTLGSSSSFGVSVGNRSNYSGPTHVNGSASLIAGATDALSPNSDFTIAGDNSFGGSGAAILDVNGYNNTINSLSGTSAGMVTNNVNTVQYNVSYVKGIYGNAPITANANSSSLVQNSAGYQITTTSPYSSAILTIGNGATLAGTSATFAGVVQDGSNGSIGIAIGGALTQTLSGINTYTGPTTINAGTLSIASTGSIGASSVVTVNAGGTLRGVGQVYGPVTVQSSGNISAGLFTTPGALLVGSLTFVDSGNYQWKITDATGAAGSGYDTLNSSGALTLPSKAVNVILDSLGTTPAHFTATNSYTWTLGTFNAGITGFNSSIFNVNASNFTGGNLLSTFTVSQSGNALLLNYVSGPVLTNLTWNGSSGDNFNGTGKFLDSNSLAATWSSGNTATFGNAGQTVVVDAPTQVQALVFNSTGYTLSGTSALSVSPPSGNFTSTSLTVDVANAGTTATINAPINSPLNVVGGGTLVLGSTSNNFGSGITVGGGILQGSTATIGSSTHITNNALVVFAESSGAANFAGTISGGGVVVKRGTSVLTLSGTNLYTGGTILQAGGALKITADANLGDVGGSVTFDGGSLDLTGIPTGLITGRKIIITGNAGSFTDAGAGANTVFNGGASIASGATFTKNGVGAMQINTSPFNGAGTIAITGGSLFLGSESLVNPVDSTGLLGNNSLAFSSASAVTPASLTVAGSSDTGASLKPNITIGLASSVDQIFSLHIFKSGGGSGALNPSLTGATTINANSKKITTFSVDASADANNAVAGTSKVSLGAVTVPFVGTVNSQVLDPATVGNVVFQTFANASSKNVGLQFNGVYIDNFNNTTFLGNGNFSSGVSPGYGVAFNTAGAQPTGPWTIGDVGGTNAQIVQLSAANAASPGNAITANAVLINSGSQLMFTVKQGTYTPKSITINGSGPIDPTVGDHTGALQLAGSAKVLLNGPVTLNTDSIFNVTQASADQPTILQLLSPFTQGVNQLTIQGNTNLNNLGVATVEFSAVNPVSTGATVINGGTLSVDAISSMGKGDLTLAQHRDHTTFLVLNNAAQAIGNLWSTYSEVSGGNPGTQTITLNGTILSITQTKNLDYGILTADGNGGLGGTILLGSHATIAGSGGITLSAASTATLSLSDVNTYAGTTTISGGHLLLANSNAVENSTVSNGITNGLQFDSSDAGSTSFNLGGLAGSGNLSLISQSAGNAAATLTVGSNNANTTYGGILSGTGASLLKSGLGTLILANANTYDGGTTLNAGAIQLGNGTTTNGSVAGGIVNNSALIIANPAIQTVGNAISGTGTLTKTGAGVAALTGSNSYSGATTINAGTLAIGGDSELGTVSAPTVGQLTLNGGTLEATASFQTITNRGLTIGASGGSIQTDAGQLTVQGQTSFAPGAHLAITSGSSVKFAPTQNGILSGVGTSGPTAVTVTVATGATLELAGSNSSMGDGAATGASGKANVVTNSTAQLVVSGTNQQVGFISGVGSTTVGTNGTNGDLSANGIIQSSLTIGAGAVFTLRPSDPTTGNPLVDSAASQGSFTSPNLLLANLLTARWTFASGVSGSSSLSAASSTTSSIGGGASLSGSLGASVSAVPEPSTLVLGAFAMLGLLGVGLRQRGRMAAR